MRYIDIYTQENTNYYIVSDCQYCIRAINEWLPTWMEEKRDIQFFDIWKKNSLLTYTKKIYYFWYKLLQREWFAQMALDKHTIELDSTVITR